MAVSTIQSLFPRSTLHLTVPNDGQPGGYIDNLRKAILDYAIGLGAGSYVLGVLREGSYYCTAIVSVQSSSRAIAIVAPQPENYGAIFVFSYNNGTYDGKKANLSNL